MKEKTKNLWKTIPASFESHGHKWEMNKWFKVDGKLELCCRGFHASEKIYDAFSYVRPGWICRVAVCGKSDVGDDKSCHSKMMIIDRKEWKKDMSIKLAIYSAELVIDIFEVKYPKDTRPREAIEAAKKYLRGEITHNAAADAAYAAAYAAYAAANAAADAANAAAHAAYAAYAADAADAAYAAAYAAHAAADLTKIIAKIENKIKELVGYNETK